MGLMKLSLVLLLAYCTLPIIQHSVVAEIICENLPTSSCAFAVSSSGKRCVLEDTVMVGDNVDYKCKTSEVVVGSSNSEYLETDKCVKTCGADRKSVGMSSDPFLDPKFTAKLCSHACYDNCPNLVDLYSNVAAGEGAYLPDLCEKIRSGEGSRRGMAELLQSGDGPALAPDSLPRRAMVEAASPGSNEADAPAPSPF